MEERGWEGRRGRREIRLREMDVKGRGGWEIKLILILLKEESEGGKKGWEGGREGGR